MNFDLNSHEGRVNLLHLRKCENHLSSISRSIVRLARITLQIDRLQSRDDGKLRVQVSKIRDLVVACPKLFELLQVGDVLDF